MTSIVTFKKAYKNNITTNNPALNKSQNFIESDGVDVALKRSSL